MTYTKNPSRRTYHSEQTDCERIAANIDFYLNHCRLTRVELAREIGMSYANLCRVMREGQLMICEVVKIAEVFKIHPAMLFEGTKLEKE